MGRITHAPSVTGGEKRELASPFPGEAVVYVRRELGDEGANSTLGDRRRRR
jgi:hypothetical protein